MTGTRIFCVKQQGLRAPWIGCAAVKQRSAVLQLQYIMEGRIKKYDKYSHYRRRKYRSYAS